MDHHHGPDHPQASSEPVPTTRGYQQEMLDESLRRNIIIALDTGSGKTHIAVLRMKIEAEREPVKVSWFMAPTVALCEQQRDVIMAAIPVSVGFISGALEPNQWKDPVLWQSVLNSHRIMVSTPQVLLDALRHGYVNLANDIGLLVFDEAHHAADKHPYNLIMKEFYMCLPPSPVRPQVLGLTASPTFGGHVETAFWNLELNLDSDICTPKMHQNELAQFVHRPVFKHHLYPAPNYFAPPLSSTLASLRSVIKQMDIMNDPYVQSLQARLQSLQYGEEWNRTDQKLSKTITKQNTYTYKGLQALESAAAEICVDVGPWAADWYIAKVVAHARSSGNFFGPVISVWQNREKTYLLEALARIRVTAVSHVPEDIVAGTSAKAHLLVESLLAEKSSTEAHDEAYSGLIFVTRRDTVLALTEVLSYHPLTKDVFRVGCLLGSSESVRRQAFLDITRQLLRQPQADTLMDFRTGVKNLLVSTSVAEEGIDIQACGSVTRWDPPSNMVSWAQSRGRARRERSTFILMFPEYEHGPVHQDSVSKWVELEKQMIALYNDSQRALRKSIRSHEMASDEGEDDDCTLRVPATGAILTLHSAVAHLAHFCAVIPGAAYMDHKPIYDIDPPDMPEGWHSFGNRQNNLLPYQGPWGSTVTLPRLLDPNLRSFSVERQYRTKRSAHQHAAFKAYSTLYKVGLLNEHLLPLSSFIESNLEEEVTSLLKDVGKRAGTADVSGQMDPWAPSDDSESSQWYSTELAIAGLPPLQMFTRTLPATLEDEEQPTLYYPNRDPIKVRMSTLGVLDASDERLERARQYTRRTFWASYGPRMKWNDMNFSYLFLPLASVGEDEWENRRLWSSHRSTQVGCSKPGSSLSSNAEDFGFHFSFPNDLTSVRNGDGTSKVFRFVRWRFDPVSVEEEEELRQRYRRQCVDLIISYPLLEVEAIPKRMNCLRPLPSSTPPPPRTWLLIPKYSTIDLLSADDVDYATFLPSIVRVMSMAITVTSLRDKLFSPAPLSFIPLKLLTTAVTAPVSGESTNYQRLETLGDTVLKFMAGIQLLSEHPLWHEGYLSKKKDHAVANVCLAKEALGKRLYCWIIRDRLIVKKWKPQYLSSAIDIDCDITRDAIPALKSKTCRQQLSTKVLADVVESLIGAAYLHGGFDLAVDCGEMFDLGLKWQKLPVRIEDMLTQREDLKNWPTQIDNVERMLGYSFRRKVLLVEALTHASHQQDLRTISYERMEFLGDSVLDMIVTDYLYRAPGKEYSPGHMHLRKSAVVNAHFLAFICLRCYLPVDASMPGFDGDGSISLTAETHRIYLWQCLLHSSHHVLQDQTFTFHLYRRAEADIERALQSDSVFPWAPLTRLQAPKFFSDMIESILGAVFLDSAGDLDVVRSVLRKLGILQVLERIVLDDVDVLHPVSRMSVWASRQHKKIEYRLDKLKGKTACSVLVDGKELVNVEDNYRGKKSEKEVTFLAAEQAIKILHLREAIIAE